MRAVESTFDGGIDSNGPDGPGGELGGPRGNGADRVDGSGRSGVSL
ncbi:hypothetical protein OG473_38085 [Streptomyces anulatus]|nr:hypothetical protein OG391_00125 [Streptomyces anulatus]WSU94205.1 hypothetical protein OG575_38570 [Streptomyces anulatus]WSW80855.1 hypothetical protein OG536_00670 [Streptomyces anulatus]